jgi:hypothetical protein
MKIERMSLFQPEPHPLKAALRKRKIRLWMIRKFCDVPESQLSRYLNGIEPMPPRLEGLIGDLLYKCE